MSTRPENIGLGLKQLRYKQNKTTHLAREVGEFQNELAQVNAQKEQ
jgi:hypothetical protein